MKTVHILLALFCFSVFTAPAGIQTYWWNREWFAGSNKILVLEYESPIGGREGVQLAELIGRMALSTTTGVEQFAVITLRQEEPRIDLTVANVKAAAERQRAPVVIWGEFYQQKGRLFITSHLRYTPSLAPPRPKDATASKFSWDIAPLNIPEKTHAYAALPSAQINFAPIEITTANLKTLETVWRRSLTIYEEPDERSKRRGELALDEPYSIQGSGDALSWSEVTSSNSMGWVLLGDLRRLNEFNELTGVVLYAQGLMQYQTFNYAAAAETFNQYLATKYTAKQDPMNRAMAHLLAGYSRMKASSDVEAPLKHFAAAKQLIPNASSPVNSIALALFAKAVRSGANEAETLALEKDLIRAIQTENDVDSIRNLEILYRLPQAEVFFQKKSPNFLQARDAQLNVLRELEQQAQSGPNS